MKISDTSPVRFVTAQEPARKPLASAQIPLAAARPDPAKPLASPTTPTLVQTQPATEPVTYTVHNRRAAAPANDNQPPPRSASLQNSARSAYEMVAGFELPS